MALPSCAAAAGAAALYPPGPDVYCATCGRPLDAQERLATAVSELVRQLPRIGAPSANDETCGVPEAAKLFRIGELQSATGDATYGAANGVQQVAHSLQKNGSELPLRPVSPARAAKLLGVSKTRTLSPAIKAGVIRTVAQGKRKLIPPDEMRRLAAEGINALEKTRRSRSQRHVVPTRDLAAELARVAALRRQ